jgi:hypothetical protein
MNMPSHQDILDELPRLLEELSGMVPEAARLHQDNEVDAVIRLGERLLVIDAKANARPGVLARAVQEVASAAQAAGPHAYPVVAVPYMGEAGRRICQDAGVGFVDLSGNAHIKAPPLIIHVTGKSNRFIHRGRPSSAFAPKASRVARLMLFDPQRWWAQHELAEAGQLGAGYVSRICKRLKADGLVERNPAGAVRPREARLLLEAWHEEYEFDKHDVLRGHVSARSGDELAKRVAGACEHADAGYALTGLAGAWLLAPFAGYRLVTVYLQKRASPKLLDAIKWKEAERGANLWLVRPNDGGVFHGASEMDGLRCVSPVQLYLDLQHMPERAEEAASRLREELLPWA